MPLEGNVRYRYRELPSGERQRLAFRNNKVIEVKGFRKRKGKVRGYIRRL
ncbi:MAG: hypothetical protein AABY22_32595 [Nanoarchaeota archaeon]